MNDSRSIQDVVNKSKSIDQLAQEGKLTRQELLELEEKLHFAEKFKRLVEVTDEITARCNEIERINRGFTFPQYIDENAKTVRQLLNGYLDENFG